MFIIEENQKMCLFFKENQLCNNKHIFSHQFEKHQLEGDVSPETAEDFDRLTLQSPDSSLVWLRYMAYHLESAETEKARAIAERALKTISFRQILAVHCILIIRLSISKFVYKSTFGNLLIIFTKRNNEFEFSYIFII